MHYVANEPPMVTITACKRRIGPFPGLPSSRVTTDAARVTCKLCRRWLDEHAAVRAPRVLPPSDEMPF